MKIANILMLQICKWLSKSNGNVMYLPLEVAIRGLASSESALIATAFLKLFMALPPTLAALAALAANPGWAWLEDTGKKIAGVNHLRFRETARRHRYLKNFCGNQKNTNSERLVLRRRRRRRRRHRHRRRQQQRHLPPTFIDKTTISSIVLDF